MAEYEALHNKYTDHVRDLTYEMRGFYLKNAQMMSTRDEFVPKQYLGWCKETQVSARTVLTTTCQGDARLRLQLSVTLLPADTPLLISAICRRRTTARPSSRPVRLGSLLRRSLASHCRRSSNDGTTSRWPWRPSVRSTARGCSRP